MKRWSPLALVALLCACPSTDPDVTSGDATTAPDQNTTTDTVSSTDVPRSDAPATPDVPVVPDGYTYTTTCQLPNDPSPQGTTVGYEPAFSGVGVSSPLVLTHAGDGTNRIFVAERPGRVKVFAKDDPASGATPFVDLRDAVDTGSEGGLLGLAFHPNYAENGYFYTSYTSSTVNGDGQFYNVLSRWKVSDDDPNAADPNSELIFLTVFQTAKNHNGGDLKFGPDGFLYMGIGDGGPQGDPSGHGQNTATWLGSVIRIDVDNPTSVDKPYSIPADNPFAQDNTGQIKEIYAWGFRNPWRMSFDRLTGAFWVADVGQNRIEEATIVTNGTNAGWNVLEGPECYSANSCDASGMKVPEVWYYHAVSGKEGAGRSITGGYVYRGTQVPSLYGAYLYADWNNPYVWAYKHGEEAMPNPDDGSDALFEGPGQIGAFGEDEDGEVYMLKLYGGEPMWRFVESTTQPAPTDFPQTLSATGCFTDVATLETVEGVLPYTVNAPFWSDGAEKRRWVALPQDGKIDYRADGQWTLPVGTVTIKHFELETVEGDPSSAVRLETRFLVQEPYGQVRGYTYRWNDEGTEAYLLPGGDSRELTVTRSDGSSDAVTWPFPSRAQCTTCHNGVVGGPLGLETGQLNNASHAYPGFGGAVVNTIEALSQYGLFHTPPEADPESWNRYPGLADSTASVADRARAYLQTNCANCHQQQSTAGTTLNLAWATELADMAACDETPSKDTLGLASPRIIVPGDSSNSVLYQRMMSHEPAVRMPPLSSFIVHTEATAVIADWIDGLDSCP